MDSITLSAQGVILDGVKNNKSTSECGAISARPDPPTAIRVKRSDSVGLAKGCRRRWATFNATVTMTSVK